MKAILEFNLPEEEIEIRDAMNGTMWRSIVVALHEKLRQCRKSDQSDIPVSALIEFLNEECDARQLDPFSV
jgi:hypothetical protein